MGQIIITATGSMNPAGDAKGKAAVKDTVVTIDHTGSNDETFAAAHVALDKIKSDLRAKLGDAGY